jgi:hypothetical protein
MRVARRSLGVLLLPLLLAAPASALVPHWGFYLGAEGRADVSLEWHGPCAGDGVLVVSLWFADGREERRWIPATTIVTFAANCPVQHTECYVDTPYVRSLRDDAGRVVLDGAGGRCSPRLGAMAGTIDGAWVVAPPPNLD